MFKYYRRDIVPKIVITAVSTVFFIVGFIINITSNQAPFNLTLNVVPTWQTQNPVINSQSFIIFMNVVSNLFDPQICAGYILIFYLLSHRKLQILVFLIWFIFLSFILSLLKEAIQQPRPYWVPGNDIEVKQRKCYYEYGCPSGHSMMGLILMEFVLRFFSRVHACISKFEWVFLILIAGMQFCIMLSRVVLGMHSINQVMFGCMIGIYTFVPYYLFIERFITSIILTAFKNPKSVPVALGLIFCFGVEVLIMILLTFLPTYNNTPYVQQINSTKCSENFSAPKAFQYKCLQDSALIMAAFGIIFGLNINSRPHRFSMLLDYTRRSLKFLARFILTLVIGLIPVGIFVINPLWAEINTSVQGVAMIIWVCNTVGFFLGMFFLVYLAPLFCDYLSLQTHEVPQNYGHFTKDEAYQLTIGITGGDDHNYIRQTQMPSQIYSVNRQSAPEKNTQKQEDV